MKRCAMMAGAFCLCIALVAGCAGGNDPAPTRNQAAAVAAAVVAAPPAQAETAAIVPVTASAMPATSIAPIAPAGDPTGDPKRAVIAALQAQMKAGPYRMRTTVVSANGMMELTGEMIPPDRLHMIMKRGDSTSESIYIGDRGWSKVDGRWIQSPLDASRILAKPGEAAAEELEKSIGDVQAVGSDTVNGQPALVYAYTSTTDLGGAGQAVSEIRLWVSLATGLPIKLETQGEVMGVESTTTQWVEHDPAITIEPPVQ